MCNRCVATEVVSRSGVVAHIGYGDPEADPYDRLLDGDIALEAGESKRRLSPSEYLKLWRASLLEKPGFGEVTSGAPPEADEGCGICGEYLVTVPGVDAECAGCDATKHGTIRDLSENREQVREDMREHFGAEGAGHGKQNDPIELAVRAGLHCPNGHWVCSDCLTFRRDEIGTRGAGGGR